MFKNKKRIIIIIVLSVVAFAGYANRFEIERFFLRPPSMFISGDMWIDTFLSDFELVSDDCSSKSMILDLSEEEKAEMIEKSKIGSPFEPLVDISFLDTVVYHFPLEENPFFPRASEGAIQEGSYFVKYNNSIADIFIDEKCVE